jgi:Fe2+ transport system protein FeoA
MSDTTLASAPPGTPLTVLDIDGSTPAARRLVALGFRPGTPVMLVARTPFGDPLVVALDGGRLALRRDEAALVHVVAEGTAA